MGTHWINGVSIATCDGCDNVISVCRCDYSLVNGIFEYAQGNNNGWEYICESFTHDELNRFIFECHKSSKPPTYFEAFSYVRRLVNAHNAR